MPSKAWQAKEAERRKSGTIRLPNARAPSEYPIWDGQRGCYEYRPPERPFACVLSFYLVFVSYCLPLRPQSPTSSVLWTTWVCRARALGASCRYRFTL